MINDLNEIEIHKKCFYEHLNKIDLEKLRKVYFKSKIKEIISKLEVLKSKPNTKSSSDYYILQRYQLLEIGGTQRLIKKIDEKNEIKYICAFVELFDEIYPAHLVVGHGGIRKTEKECQKKVIIFTSFSLTFLINFVLDVS